MGAAELMGGVSYAVGPPVGGLLFEYGGFAWPFVIQGLLPVLFAAGLQARAARQGLALNVAFILTHPCIFDW
jgi:MFS family permease